MKPLFKSLLVAGVLSTATMAVFSQSGPSAMDHGMAGHSGKSGMRYQDPAKMEQMVNKRLAELKGKLKITASQESAWSTFTTAMKPSGMAAMGQRPDSAELAKLPMPQRMDAMRTMRKERMAAMEAGMTQREDAAKALYAVLSPEQQKLADAEHSRLLGGHHGKHGRADASKPAAAGKS